MNVHAEICYENTEGMSVHSDICPPTCSPSGLSDAKWREFLHANLDEWLDKGNGSGGFFIGSPEFFAEYFEL